MNSFKLGFAALLLASATVSLTTAGTPNILVSPKAALARPAVNSGVGTDRDLTREISPLGSPKANTLAADVRRTGGATMDCCSAVLAGSPTLSPRAAAPRSGTVSPVGVKCSMGQQTAATPGCCAPAANRKPTCCG